MSGANLHFRRSLLEIEEDYDSKKHNRQTPIVVFFPIAVRLGAVARGIRRVIADGKFVALVNLDRRFKAAIIRLAIHGIGEGDGVIPRWAVIFGSSETKSIGVCSSCGVPVEDR